ncbi:MAG: tRNA pseudouridine(38-40) synthase TruA [Dysgonamonadaceae bacterium]|jgi:tRNA pseudouridine38-40 synthase|nr:tRNA pseudouridine(38-40) synthase TruA [Dysgonamonadaceae bacterium]
MRYFIHLSYNGKNYCGWQNQPNGISVQQKLEETLGRFLKKKIAVTGAGRTDAGVHARSMVAHFDWEGDALDVHWVTEKLNRMLPPDIAVFKTMPVHADAHARFDAISRTYKYYVAQEKNPFRSEYTYFVAGKPDIEKMNRAADKLLEYTDFTSFSKLHTDVKTNRCTIFFARWEREGSELVFTIQADRFLRNMVRAIVGTLLDVGRGKLSIEGFCRIIASKDRGRAGCSVPGNALFLEGVDYAYCSLFRPVC